MTCDTFVADAVSIGDPVPNFCVNMNAQSNGDHEVHDLSADCSFLPASVNRQALGNHATCRGAVQAAKSYYSQVNGCYYCATDCNTG
ncbi:MAG: hypothetical protein WKF73_10270 [Nocardioidaceae bacterium]